MTRMTRATHLFLAIALSCLVMAIFLIKQYKLGIPYSFGQSMTLAALTGIAVPVAATVAYAMLRRGKPGRMLVFELTCAALAVLLAVLTF